jgi:mannose-1-phosphate guanylyltransferase
MLKHASRAMRYVQGKSASDRVADSLLFDAATRCVQIVGEAAWRLSEESRAKLADVPWQKIIACRHIIVHECYRIDPSLIWRVCTQHLQVLVLELESHMGMFPFDAAVLGPPQKRTPTDNFHVRVLLTAAGVGSRLRPLTDRMPKCLVPIAGRPLLDYWFDAFEASGIRHVLINTHHLPEQVRDYLRLVSAGGRFEVSEAHEPRLLGSAGTITANKGFVPINSEALIIYSDNLSSIDLSWFLAMHRTHTDPFTMLLFRAQFPEKSGIAELPTGADPSRPQRVLSFVEKPKEPRSNLANAGLYAMTGELWHEIASWNAFDIGFDVIPRLVGRMHAIEHAQCPGVTPYHRDIGTLESLAIAEREAPQVFGARPPRTPWAPS